MTWAKKVDATHREVRDTLRACGLIVVDVSKTPGLGCDLIAASRPRPGTRECRLAFVEVKVARARRDLTHSERTLASNVGDLFVVLASADEAAALARELRPR